MPKRKFCTLRKTLNAKIHAYQRFQHVKAIKKICIQHRKLVEKIKQIYRLKLFPDNTFDDSCNLLAYRILDLVRSPLKGQARALKELRKVRFVQPILCFTQAGIEAIDQNKPIDNVYVVETANKFTNNYQVVRSRKYVLNDIK
ncbi:hypothetical protein NIES4071_104970 (plasmid) [Calothrix sp. NIES-4071]|nr:hypothetical protein NIES4071_104970 [Calothrix sp. NIES-4071]BAZ64915.1 hypothetical protein NIES4105_106480 [Calothrix sp. NIES-4105]